MGEGKKGLLEVCCVGLLHNAMSSVKNGLFYAHYRIAMVGTVCLWVRRACKVA
jgi:hypothetical protein